MNTTTTIHDQAQFLLHISSATAGWRDDHPRCPEWIARKIIAAKRRAAMRRSAREAIARAGEMSTRHLARDYRGWGDPGAGWRASGRTADWCSFGLYAQFAEKIHQTTGWSGEAVRQATAQFRRGGYGHELLVCPGTPLPDHVLREERARSRREGGIWIDGYFWSHSWAEGFPRHVANRAQAENALDWWLWREAFIPKG